MTTAVRPEIEISKRRKAILTMIRRFISEHGYSPTLREIQAKVGLKTPSAVAYQLEQLAQIGEVRYASDSPRTIVLLGGPCAHCGGTGLPPDGAL